MPELTVRAALPHQPPALGFEQSDDVPHLHRRQGIGDGLE